MKKRFHIFVLSTLLLIFSGLVPCHAKGFLEGLFKADVSLLKAQIEKMESTINMQNKLIVDLNLKIQAMANANVKAFAGIDQSLNQQMNAGRDNVSITTDPKILRPVIVSMAIVILMLVSMLGLAMRSRANFMNRLLNLLVNLDPDSIKKAEKGV